MRKNGGRGRGKDRVVGGREKGGLEGGREGEAVLKREEGMAFKHWFLYFFSLRLALFY